jgi:O-antigen/teichoic acid export membrane protein
VVIADLVKRTIGKNRFLVDSAIVFLASIVSNLSVYSVHFVVSRRLGVADYGDFASLLSAQMLLGVPAVVVGIVVTKSIAESWSHSDEAKVQSLARGALWCGLAFGVAVYLLAKLNAESLSRFYHISSSDAITAASISLAMIFLAQITRSVLQGTQDFKRFSMALALDALARASLAILAVIKGYGVAGAFWGYVTGSCIAVVYGAYMTRTHWLRRGSRASVHLRPIMQSASGTMLAIIGLTSMGFLDLPIAKHYLSAPEAGLYSAVAVCGRMLFFVVSFIPLLVLPKVSGAGSDAKSSSRVLFQALVLLGTIAAVGLAGEALFSHKLISMMYGDSFMGAATLVPIYGFAMALLAGTNVLANYNIARHRFNFTFVLALALALEIGLIFRLHATSLQIVLEVLSVNALSFAVLAYQVFWQIWRERKRGVLITMASDTALLGLGAIAADEGAG